MGKERNTGPDYQEILKELEKKDSSLPLFPMRELHGKSQAPHPSAQSNLAGVGRKSNEKIDP